MWTEWAVGAGVEAGKPVRGYGVAQAGGDWGLSGEVAEGRETQTENGKNVKSVEFPSKPGLSTDHRTCLGLGPVPIHSFSHSTNFVSGSSTRPRVRPFRS